MQRTIFATILATFVAVNLLGDRTAEAVWYNPRGIGIGMGVGMGVGAYGAGYGLGYGGYGYGGYGGFGGTAGGNYLQGMSQVIRSEGEYREQVSKAQINYEEARSKYIDNRKKWTDTYLSMREENQAKETEKLEKSRHSQESLRLAGQSSPPKPIGSEMFNPTTGKIVWPEVLMAPEYTAPREEINRQFELRASTGGNEAGMKVYSAAQKMIDTLKDNIQSLPTNDYISARKFLDSLAHAARS